MEFLAKAIKGQETKHLHQKLPKLLKNIKIRNTCQTFVKNVKLKPTFEMKSYIVA